MKFTKALLLSGLAVAGTLAGQPARAQSQGPGQGQNYCREYTRKVVIGNTVQNAYGTACRQPDGSWQIVNQEQGDQVVEPVPPPQDARVTYVVHGDAQPIYVEPQYVTYRPWADDYAYGYPFWYGGYYGGGHYDHGYGGHYGGRGGGYDGGRGYRR